MSQFFRLSSPQFQMHLSIFLWGFTGVLGRLIELNEGLLVWYRMLITVITLGLYAWYLRKSLRLPQKNLIRLAGVGAILALHWVLFYGAIKYSNISVTLSTFSSTSLFTALMEPLVHRKKINRNEIGLSLIAMAGILIIFGAEFHYLTGILLSLAATFVGTFFNIFNKPIVQQTDPVVVSFYEIFFGWAGLTLTLPLYLHSLNTPFVLPHAGDWIYLLILAVFCTHFTLILSLNALKQLSAFTLNLAINLEPVYGITLAVLLFGKDEKMSPAFYAGAALVMLSVVLHAYLGKNKTAESA